MSKPKKSPTLAELGRRLNLTPRAVSQAINGGQSTVKVSEKTRQRVLDMAAKLNYRPNFLARTLRTGKSGLIGVVAQQTVLEIFHRMLFFSQREIFRHGFKPMISLLAGDDADASTRAFEQMLDSNVDGILVLGGIEGADAFNQCRQLDIPVVAVCTRMETAGAVFLSDERMGFRRVASHVLELGRSKLLLAGVDLKSIQRNWHARSAVAGIRDAVSAVRKHGGAVDFDVAHLECEFSGIEVPGVPHLHGIYAPGYLLMRSLIEQQKLPDALVCTNDSWALGSMLACAEAGIRIPQDIALTGFDDDAAGSAGLLPLTTVRQPVGPLLREAMDCLQNWIKRGEGMHGREVVLPCELVVRASTVGRPGVLPKILPQQRREKSTQ